MAVAVTEFALPGGVIAVIRLRQPGAPRDYIAVSRRDLDDEVVLRSLALALQYRVMRPDDISAVEILLRSDGPIEGSSESHGPFLLGPGSGQVKDRYRNSSRVLRMLESFPLRELAGIGQARIADWHNVG